ncbi:MAG TPA: electron transfer flavoprotein subunit alpha/FixB family protein [Acidimicrobiia bacterium]|jgi:electron transfer flavoprotein alpha subunit|nr:electron transfer flavoprotein subunit alpha/FixB family protein [Acidimicrobiia bacterium]
MAQLVFADGTSGEVSQSALESLTKVRSFQGTTGVFHVGPASDEAFAAYGAHGADRVYHLATDHALPAAQAAAAIASLLDGTDVGMVVFSMGNLDRDVAGRLSARLGAPVLANAVDIAVDGGNVSVTNEILGGTTRVTTAATGDGPAVVVARPKAFPAEPSGGGTPEVNAVDMPDVGHAGAVTVTERHVEESQGPDLEAANVVISGGRGLGGADKFEMVQELASLLGGAVGATRAVVDSGWVPYSLQVGQTGKTVKPDVYIACGISGAMQHVVGMKDASTIIAINKDPEAPIFGLSDLGIVGDVHKVVPALIEALKAR